MAVCSEPPAANVCFLSFVPCATHRVRVAGDAGICGVATRRPSRQDHYLQIFEQTWRIVNETYFDPGFGGLDWDNVRKQYRPHIVAASSETEFYRILNSMLFELSVSHALVGPINGLPDTASAYMFAEGTIGIDVRILEGRVVITSVDEDSPAEHAGLRSGFVIRRIGEESVEDIMRNATPRPPYNERHKRFLATEELLRRIFGKAGTSVTLAWEDGERRGHEGTLRRIRRQGGTRLLDGVPPVFLECERRMLDDHFVYVRFNAFQPNIPEQVIDSVRTLSDASGVIIDLRGNNGGATEAVRRVAARLLTEPVSNCVFKSRDETIDLALEPAESRYAGPLVLLVDVMSISSAELFCASLQAAGRATVVGERTPGVVTGSNTRMLAGGVVLTHPVQQITMRDGTTLEGHGVIPDFEVQHTAGALLENRDLQLEVAVRLLRSSRGR